MITEIVEMIANDIKEKFPDEYNDKNLFEDFDKDSFGYYDEEHKRLREGVVYRNYEEGISFKEL